MIQPRSLSTISMTLALTLIAGHARAEQPVVAEATQAEIDQELAEMAAIAAAKLAPKPPVQLVTPPSIAPVAQQEAAPAASSPLPAIVPPAKTASTQEPPRGSMLGDTIAQLVPSLLRRRQATIAPESPSATPTDRNPANLSREIVLTSGGDAFIDSSVTSGKTIVLPPRESTSTTSFDDVYALNQRWKEQDRAAAESRARRTQTPTEQPLYAAHEPDLSSITRERPSAPSHESSESWRVLAEPGHHHQLLDIFAGTWQVEGRFETQPGQPPEIATGTMVSTWQLGQRWLRQEYTGSMPSLGTFEGIGFFGYDNAKNKFVATWMDTLSTTAMTSHGTFNEMATSFTLNGAFTAPDGGSFVQKQVLTVQSRDRYTVALSLIGPDQTETPTGTVIYTRLGGIRTFTNEGGSSLQP